MATTTLRDVPDDIWREFRKLCLDERISSNAKIIQLITLAIQPKEEGKK